MIAKTIVRTFRTPLVYNATGVTVQKCVLYMYVIMTDCVYINFKAHVYEVCQPKLISEFIHSSCRQVKVVAIFRIIYGHCRVSNASV